MKKLNSTEEVKKFSIALQKFLKENEIEVKHSLMLEGIAKSMDVKDWNTLSALLGSSSNIKSFDAAKFAYDDSVYIRKENNHNQKDGYQLYYDREAEILKITTNYEHSVHFFSVSMNALKEMTGIIYSAYQSMIENQPNFIGSSIKIESKECPLLSKTEIEINMRSPYELSILLENNTGSLNLFGLKNIPALDALFKFLNSITEEVKSTDNLAIYPLTNDLLSSMAMRYDHSFGLIEEEEEIAIILERMKNLYILFQSGVSDADIHNKTKMGITSIKQLREETNGTGFYSPSETPFSFKINK